MVYVDTSTINMDEINKAINNNDSNENGNNDDMGDIIVDEHRVREIVREELANFKPKKREKRPPNKWQLFLKECTKEQPKDFSYPEKVKACSVKYREKKNNG